MKLLLGTILGLIAIYGIFFALYPYYFIFDNIDQIPQTTKVVSSSNSVVDGIEYRTDGPSFASMSTECYSDQNDAHCILLKSDGTPGLVQIKIPASTLLGKVTAVKVGWFHETDLKFDLIGAPSSNNVIRFLMPEGQRSVQIHSSGFAPYLVPFLLANLIWPTMFVIAAVEKLRTIRISGILQSIRKRLDW